MSIEICPCGLEGSECSDPVSPLTDVNEALERACSLTGTEECLVDGEGASCKCICGFGGDFCENSLAPEAYNLAIGFLFAVFVWTGGLYYIHIKEKQRTDTINKFKTQFTTSPFESVPPVALLVWRVISLLIVLAFIPVFAVENPIDFLSFSLVSWMLEGITFLLGTIISLKAFMNPPAEDEPAGTLEYWFQVGIECVLPAGTIVAVVFWGVLVPTADEDDVEFLTSYFQFFVHGVNLLLIFVECGLNDLYIIKFHVFYVMALGCEYLFFHQFWMLFYVINNEPPCPQYFFLDMSQGLYFPFIAGLLIAFAGFFAIFYCISNCKKNKLHGEGYGLVEDEK